MVGAFLTRACGTQYFRARGHITSPSWSTHEILLCNKIMVPLIPDGPMCPDLAFLAYVCTEFQKSMISNCIPNNVFAH